MNISEIKKILGEESDYLLSHKCQTISKDLLHLPEPDFVENIFNISDRSL